MARLIKGNVMFSKKILCVCGILFSLANAKAITLNEISSFLVDPDLTQMKPNQLINYNNFFGKLSVLSESAEEMLLTVEKKPNSLDATYVKLEGQWVLNDVSFNYYAGNSKNCDRQQDAYIKHLTKKLGAATFGEENDGIFWQLPKRDWGIWLVVNEAMNPFTKITGCSSKIILIYSDLDAQNGDEDF